MSNSTKRRPNSHRKAISYQYFSTFVSYSRLRNVQSLLGDTPIGQDVKRPHAVLCILGIDSRFNEGHNELANYLLFDFLDGQNGEIMDDDDTHEDVLLLITQSAVHVYCNPLNYPQLMPYIAHWPNLRLHCLNEHEYENDRDAGEEFKILSFITMCRECYSIGMPFGTRSHPVAFDPFMIEKWPIVQASALEDFGGGGFFTMKHEIVNINKDLWNLFDSVDPVDLEILVTKKLPLMEKQWSNTITNINIAFASNSAGELTEEDVGEPLRSFFAFGNLAQKGTTDEMTRLPYCLFGQHSSTPHQLQEPSKSLGSSGVNNSQAMHMVCQAVSSKIPVSCSRTYFFTSGHTPYPLSARGAVHAPRPPKTDIELLEKLYKAVIASVICAIDVYCSSSSVTKSKQACLESLKEICSENVIPTGLDLLQSENALCFFLHGLNMFGSPVSLEDNCLPGGLKLAGLKLLNIPSIEHPGCILGSLEFSETFLSSKIFVEIDDEVDVVNQRNLILTSRIPRCMTWEMNKSKLDNSESSLQSFLHSVDKPFGEILVNGVSCSALGSKEYGAVTNGMLFICDEAVLFRDSGNHLVVFPLSYTEEMTLFDGDSFNSVSMLCLTYRHSLHQYLPLIYHNRDDVVTFILPPKTKAHRTFYSEVVSKWQKRKTDPVLKLMETVPESLSEIYSSLQMKYSFDSNTSSDAGALRMATANLEGFDRFVAHMMASSVLKNVSVPEQDLSAILKETVTGTSHEINDNIVVSLLTGVPGSHQEELCKALVNMAKEQNRWMILKPPLDSDEFFKPCVIQDALTSVCNTARKQRQSVRAGIGGGRKKLRVLLVVPGFTDTDKVVHSILNHPIPDVAKHLRIGTITCCVDPLNTFLSDRLTFPLLQDQCKRGWVNNVLFTGSTDKSPGLDFCKDMIRKTNPNVAFILAEKGEIRRSTDAESIVSETSFMDSEMIRDRHLASPGWWKGITSSSVLHPSFNKICLDFYQPLVRDQFLTNLKAIQTSTRTENLSGNVYHISGTTRFTDSDDLIEVYFTTLSGYLSLATTLNVPSACLPSTPLPPSALKQPIPPSQVTDDEMVKQDTGSWSLIFVGIDLEESCLKAWLRTCTKQKRSRLPIKTRNSLSKKELHMIHEEHHHDPLPEGWFYNGCQYVSFDGDKQLLHPNLESFVENFLDLCNEEIGAMNHQIDSEKYLDLFQQA